MRTFEGQFGLTAHGLQARVFELGAEQFGANVNRVSYGPFDSPEAAMNFVLTAPQFSELTRELAPGNWWWEDFNSVSTSGGHC